MTEPDRTITDKADTTKIELWTTGDPKRPWRLTVKRRPGVNIPHRLDAVYLFTTDTGAEVAFDRWATRLRPPNVHQINTKRRKAKAKA